MGEVTSAIILGIGSSIAAILGAYALVVKARASAARPLQVLRRVVDWLQEKGYHEQMPALLHRDVDAVLKEEGEDR